MSMSDPISDLLARIRNAILAKHDRLDVPASKLKLEVCRILKEEGYIENLSKVDKEPVSDIRIFLRYDRHGSPAIQHLARVSKPGRRVYRGAEEVPTVRNGLGTAILSTSSGVLTDRQARERRVGGEVLCEIW